MSRKHFIAFAAEVATIADRDVRRQAAIVIARVAAQSNPAFNAARFYAACNVI